MAPQLPEKVRVAGREFSLEYRKESDMEGAAGWCQWSSNSIAILEDQLPIEETDTVLHELFHAILYCQGREYGGKTEELYVRALATGLTGLLQDNPEFTKWLTSRFPHK